MDAMIALVPRQPSGEANAQLDSVNRPPVAQVMPERIAGIVAEKAVNVERRAIIHSRTMPRARQIGNRP